MEENKYINKTLYNIKKNTDKPDRKLEIGPGDKSLPGFESLNIIPSENIDYVLDASEPLPFSDNTFTVIYASHVLEHIPWYKTEEVLHEWVRILKFEGILEVWVPNGLKICKAFIDAELNDDTNFHNDKWFRFNRDKDACKWAAGRIFSYGDGSNDLSHPNWHHSIFTPRYLKKIFELAGLIDVREMSREEVRGYDHKWINLGVCGRKYRREAPDDHQSDWAGAVPPGEILLEEIIERNITPLDLSVLIDMSLEQVNIILYNGGSITEEISNKLEQVLGIRAVVWNNLEKNYRAFLENRPK